MKKVVFFIENAWAFGSIHQALSKLLYTRGIMADVMAWDIRYRQIDIEYITKSYDYFVTLPLAVGNLIDYGVPLNKIILVAHGQWDLLKANEQHGKAIYEQVKAYAVVSDFLRHKSQDFGIKRVPLVTPVGIMVDNFVRPVPKQLKTLGYASSFEHLNYQKQDIKRGYLAEAVAKQTGLKLKDNQKFYFLGMPAFYESVDAVIMTSTEESVGLPMLEAAVAGRLTIGTAVGYYASNGPKSGGVVTPLNEEAFIAQASKALNHYKNHPSDFQKACRKVQAYAKAHYDWSQSLDKWAELFS